MAEGISFNVDGNTTSAAKAIDDLGKRIQGLASKWDVSFDQIDASTKSSIDSMARASQQVTNLGAAAQKSFVAAALAAERFKTETANMGEGAEAASRGVQGATTNITAQFQDIGVQAQMGANSMAIALQQGTQLGAALKQAMGQGASGVAALGSALKELFSPMNILVIAAIAIGVELFKAFSNATQVKKFEDVLKATTGTLNEIGKAFPEVGKAVGDYEKASLSMMRGDALLEQADLMKSLTDETRKAQEAMSGIRPPDMTVPGSEKLVPVMQTLQRQAKEGSVDFDGLTDSLGAFIDTSISGDQALADTAGQLAASLEAVRQVAGGYKEVENALASFLATGDIPALVKALDDISGSNAAPELKKIADTISSKLRGANTAAQAYQALVEVLDLTAGGTRQLTAAEKQAADVKAMLTTSQKEYQTALEGMGSVVPQVHQTEEQRLATLHETARATAADREAIMAADTAYKSAVTALDAYNVSLSTRLLKGQALIDMEHMIAAAQTTTTASLAALNEQYAKQSAQAAADQSMQGLVTSLQAVEASAPKVTLTLQQQLDQWYEQQKAVGLTAEQLRLLDLQYLSLGNSISTAISKASLSVQFAQMAGTEFASLNEVIRQYAAEVENGTMTGEQFIWHLQQIADALPDGPLKTTTQNIIQMAQAALDSTGGINAMAGAAGASTSQLLAMGNAAAIAGSQLGALLALSGQTAAAISAGTSAAQSLADAAVTKPIFQNALERTIAGYKELETTAIKGALARHDTAEELKAHADFIKASAEATRQFNAAEAMKAAKAGGGGGGAGARNKLDIGGKNVNLESWSAQMLNTLDPARKLAEQIEILDAAIGTGDFPEEKRAEALKKLEEQYGKTADKAFDFQKTFATMMTQWGDSVASSLADAIVNGEDLGDVFKDLIKQLMKMALEMLVLKPLMNSIMTAVGGGGGSFLSGLFGGAAAAPAAANSNVNRYLPAPGMLSTRNGQAGGSTTNNAMTSSIGNINISFGAGSSGEVDGDGARAKKMGERIRSVIHDEMVKQSRPGGLMWSGGGRGR